MVCFHDVAIIGGGPAGCAVALSLLRSQPDASIVVFSDADPLRFKIGESLPPEAARLLRYLDASLPSTLSTHLPCAGTASAWTSSSLEEHDALMSPFGHGWHLDRARFDETLRTAARSAGPNLKFSEARVTAIRRETDLWILETEAGGSAVQSRWLVDASGRRASAARLLGLRTRKTDDLLAVHALFSSTSGTTEDRDTRTLIEACSQGWWYSALLPSKQRLVAFHCDAPSAKGSIRTRTGFLDFLHDQTNHLARIVAKHEHDFSAPDDGAPVGPQTTAACSSQLEGWQSQAYFVPVGDAALSFDPLSSQGMMTALEMGCILGTELAANLLQLEGFSDERAIVESVTERYAEVWKHFEKSRKYYYSVQSRFDGDQFWASRHV
ncbi:hypothetical protein GGX14DRAFT_454316 [Mycena pura]|uniref:FAD-binding domain-containing protein n=1 Tax=Mycena pura TaxID=153505 RepID=A0AAD6VBN6_9AGAR|nr:hypothetical protein GGX14DRAFT_454316 [Mycena pura]